LRRFRWKRENFKKKDRIRKQECRIEEESQGRVLNIAGNISRPCIFVSNSLHLQLKIITMTEEDIRKILSHGEDYNIEYKQCANEVSHSVYESIASFLNHSGGVIYKKSTASESVWRIRVG
jgi:hypothetical protein